MAGDERASDRTGPGASATRRCTFAPASLARAVLQRCPYGNLNRRIIVVGPIETYRFGGKERRLRHEARQRTPMPLRGMHQKRMTQIDGPRLPCRRGLWPAVTHPIQDEM